MNEFDKIIEDLEKEQEQVQKELKLFASNIINAVFIDLKKIVDLCNSFEDFKKVIKEIKLIENKGE